MSKARDRALKAYPIKIAERDGYDENLRERNGYVKGYHQAEKDLTDKARLSSGWDGFYYGQGYKQAKKDLELTWQDMVEIESLLNLVMKSAQYKNGYREVLKRFKDYKESENVKQKI